MCMYAYICVYYTYVVCVGVCVCVYNRRRGLNMHIGTGH